MADKYVQSSPVLKYSDGVIAAYERIGTQGQVLGDDLHGQLFEASRIGTLFFACNQAAQAVSVALATTYTGICISNPVGNNRDLIVRAMSFKLSVAQVAISMLGIMGGYISTGGVTAHTTPLVYGTSMWPCNLGSSATPTATVDSAATIVSPKLIWPLGGAFTAGAFGSDTPNFINLEGGLVLQPGAYAAIYALTAVTGFGGVWWEEIAR